MENYTAAMLEPYLLPGKKDVRGIPMVEPEKLKEAVTRLDAEGFQVHFHAIGDAAIRQSLDAVEAARTANGDQGHRHHISHIQLIDRTTMSRASRKLGVVANYQPLWAYADEYITELTIPFLGPERSSHMYAINSLEKSGATVAFGSDWSVSSPNPFEEMETAITRLGALGETTDAFPAGRSHHAGAGSRRLHDQRGLHEPPREGHGLARGRQARRSRGARPQPVRYPAD